MSPSVPISQRLSATARTLLTPTEVAERLRVHPRTVRRWAQDGLLEPVKLGGKLVRYTPESVEALMHPTTSEARAVNAGPAKLGDGPADHDRAY